MEVAAELAGQGCLTGPLHDCNGHVCAVFVCDGLILFWSSLSPNSFTQLTTSSSIPISSALSGTQNILAFTTQSLVSNMLVLGACNVVNSSCVNIRTGPPISDCLDAVVAFPTSSPALVVVCRFTNSTLSRLDCDD